MNIEELEIEELLITMKMSRLEVELEQERRNVQLFEEKLRRKEEELQQLACKNQAMERQVEQNDARIKEQLSKIEDALQQASVQALASVDEISRLKEELQWKEEELKQQSMWFYAQEASTSTTPPHSLALTFVIPHIPPTPLVEPTPVQSGYRSLAVLKYKEENKVLKEQIQNLEKERNENERRLE